MAKVTISAPDLGPQKTYLSAEVAASATTSTVKNSDGFTTGDLVLFGSVGQERSEIVTLTSVPSVTSLGHTAGPTFAHPVGTPVYEIGFNQAEVYSASSEGDTYSLLATVDLAVDETYTIYNDASGGSSTWYKVRYKNSTTSTYSDYSDEVQGAGFSENGLGSMTDEVLNQFGDDIAAEISRDVVRDHLNAGVRRMVMKIIKAFPDYFGAYDTQSLSAGTTYSYPTRFIAFQRAQIGTSITDSYQAEFLTETELDPSWTYLESDPRIVLRDSTWKTYPDCAGKTAYLYYWKYPATMSDDNDLHGLPYGGRDVIVTYALYRIWLDRDVDRATAVKRHLDNLIDEYLEFVGQARQGSNNWFQNITSGRDMYDYNWGL